MTGAADAGPLAATAAAGQATQPLAVDAVLRLQQRYELIQGLQLQDGLLLLLLLLCLQAQHCLMLLLQPGYLCLLQQLSLLQLPTAEGGTAASWFSCCGRRAEDTAEHGACRAAVLWVQPQELLLLLLLLLLLCQLLRLQAGQC